NGSPARSGTGTRSWTSRSSWRSGCRGIGRPAATSTRGGRSLRSPGAREARDGDRSEGSAADGRSRASRGSADRVLRPRPPDEPAAREGPVQAGIQSPDAGVHPRRPPPNRPRRPLRVPLLLPLPRLRPRNRRSRDMAASESPPLVKARKAPRLTAKQEIQTIRNLPRVQRGIVIMKIAGVFLLAIGFEGLVTGQYWYSVVFVPLGVLVAMLPIRIRTG